MKMEEEQTREKRIQNEIKTQVNIKGSNRSKQKNGKNEYDKEQYQETKEAMKNEKFAKKLQKQKESISSSRCKI